MFHATKVLHCMEKNFLFAFFSVACNTFWIVFVTSHTKQQHTSPRWNFLGIFNAAMLHCIYMKILHRGPKLKACVRYFLSKLYFSPNDSPSITMKNVFFITSKKLFVLEIFKFLYFPLPLFFPLSAIALEVDPRKIWKFMMSSTV